MKYHFIAIGGSAMHNLAIALHQQGDHVSGSDDEIFEPSRSRLERHGLLPPKTGWYPSRIHGELDAVIAGMHAKPDNPELLKARELDIPVYSYPEFLYAQSKNKTRVVNWREPWKNNHHLHGVACAQASGHKCRLHGGGPTGGFRCDGAAFR